MGGQSGDRPKSELDRWSFRASVRTDIAGCRVAQHATKNSFGNNSKKKKKENEKEKERKKKKAMISKIDLETTQDRLAIRYIASTFKILGPFNPKLLLKQLRKRIMLPSCDQISQYRIIRSSTTNPGLHDCRMDRRMGGQTDSLFVYCFKINVDAWS